MPEIEYLLKVENRLSTLETQMTGQDDKLDLILKEVRLTNSRVNKLETHNAVQGARRTIWTTMLAAVVSLVTAVSMRYFN